MASHLLMVKDLLEGGRAPERGRDAAGAPANCGGSENDADVDEHQSV